MISKFPRFSQWKQIFKVLSKKEQTIFLTLFAICLISLITLLTSFYINHTKIVSAIGGSYNEGVVGQPRLINPIYGETNDIDRTLIALTFSSITTYDGNGKIINDLAEDVNISTDGKIYEVKLKENAYWHDGKQLPADDIVFTVKTIQNSDYKSPLRANWLDVDVQKTSSDTVRFILRTPYNSFIESLTVKILPKHIWEKISPENFSLSPYNLQPVGSGPYKFDDIKQNSNGLVRSIYFTSNRKYHNQTSYITNLSIQFFPNKEDLIKAVNNGKIDGFALSALDDNQKFAEEKVRQGWSSEGKFSIYSLLMPRYFAVFFNEHKTSLFSDINMRKAMTYSVNKDELIEKVNKEIKNGATKVDSPILPDFFNFQEPTDVIGYNIDSAKTLLDKTGFKDNGSGQREKPISKQQAFQFKAYLKVGSTGNEVTQLQSCLARLDEKFATMIKDEVSGKYTILTENAVTEFQKQYFPNLNSTGETGSSTRQKLNELCFTQTPNSQPLRFTLTTVNQPQMIIIANILKDYWQAIGASVEINALSVTELKPVIKNRSYEALLYGEALGSEIDLYPFWHSSQVIDPGLNLSYYENKNADKLLKEARETLDPLTKVQKYESLQQMILSDNPALFLYNPNYIYWVSRKINGINTEKIIDPAKRFSNISSWYIKTKRVWN